MSRRRIVVSGIAVLGLAAAAAPNAALASTRAHSTHVLVLSVDGLHESDLARYVRSHPHSALAQLEADGTSYTSAQTTFPSDSFPGMVAQFTGAGPGTSGVFYDDTYNPTLFPPGTLNCQSTAPGTEVAWTEAADRSHDPIALDAGQNLAATALTNLPTNTVSQTLADSTAITKAILAMTPSPQALLDPAALPVSASTCLPEYPHNYLKVNTVFEVARAHGLRTAWSDKHPAYEILNGPSGQGIQDLFTPEINSVADVQGDDWTTDNALTKEYDGTKVAAVLNEIDGWDHSGTHRVGTPAIFGLNFQTVSTAEKLPVSDGLAGGYNPDGSPGPLLSSALDFVNAQVGRLVAEIRHRGLGSSTTIILSAKHGQSPIDLSDLRRVDDGAIIDAIDAAWAKNHPQAAPLVAFSVDDDVMLLWLSDRRSSALAFVASYLRSHSAPANVAGDPLGVFSTTVTSSGLTHIYTGQAADTLVRATDGDARTPDVIGIAQHGVVYTGKVSKISEHGGDAADDRDVPIVVSGAGARPGHTVTSAVQTTQIAPTILTLLGLAPSSLDGVRRDHTPSLPLG
jgi:predicted AlkP superfamily pyrophosphatase or phosphodiesterase